MRIKADSTVNLALDSRLERENLWTNKSSTIGQCDEIFQENLTADQFFIPTVENSFSLESARRDQILKAKKASKDSINQQILDLWNSKVQDLTMQGDFTQLLIEEQQSVTWQSMIRGMPRGIMAFALRLSTNSLPSPDNLKRWGKR